MINKFRLFILSYVVVFFLSPVIAYAELTELWRLEGVFIQPESAAYDPVTRNIFVSNVNGYALDGNGFVSRVKDDGTELNLKWLTNLNSPTGLAVYEDHLFVVDYDKLLKIKIESGEIAAQYPAPDARPALNDVGISTSGDVFVTGSASSTIYYLDNDGLTVWLKDTQQLKFANGLFVEQDSLILGGLSLYSIDLKSKAISKFESDGDLEHIKDIDGIAKTRCGSYWLTLIDDARIWSVDSNKVFAVSEDELQGIDLSISQNRMFLPRVGGSLSVLSLNDDC